VKQHGVGPHKCGCSSTMHRGESNARFYSKTRCLLLTELLLLQYTETQLSAIYSTFAKAIAATLGTGDSTVAALSSTTSASTLSTASGCARDTDGGLRVQFYVSADNITREIDGLLSGGRRLQSTPCSSTDGTSASPLCVCVLQAHARSCLTIFQWQCNPTVTYTCH